MTQFKDIDVIDIEENMTFQALHEPRMHYLHLKLSAVPPHRCDGAFHGAIWVADRCPPGSDVRGRALSDTAI